MCVKRTKLVTAGIDGTIGGMEQSGQLARLITLRSQVQILFPLSKCEYYLFAGSGLA